MKERRALRGQWQIYGENQPAFPGTLRFEPEDDLVLLVRVPRDPQTNPFLHFLDPEPGARDVPPLLHGTCDDGTPVTLFGCGYRSRSANSDCTDVEIRCLAALINNRLSSWDAPRFRAAEIEYSLLNNWIGQRFIPAREARDGKPSFVLPADLVIDLACGSRLRVTHGITEESIKDGRFGHSVFLHFATPLSLEAIVGRYTSVLQNLLCLLTGRPIFHDRISLYEVDPPQTGNQCSQRGAELLQCCTGVTTAERDLHGSFMPSTYAELANDLPEIVQKWFEMHERLEPVVGLFMLVRTQRVAIMQTRFLLLAQALEVYHSRSGRFTAAELSRAEHKERVKRLTACAPEPDRLWLEDKLRHANQKTLAARIAEVLTTYKEYADLLTDGIPDFAEKVRHTRNYYTHYDQETLDKGKAAQGRDLVRISVALEGLLAVCLLKELGITGKPLERSLRRYSDFKLMDTHGKHEPASRVARS